METSGEQASISQYNCIDCHTQHLDSAHDFPCIQCHQGRLAAESKENAHHNLTAHPSHPDHMLENCGKCHASAVETASQSLHFTLKNSVNSVRKAFGATDELQSFTQTPATTSPDSLLSLADDLLRRRCFRCHVYASGDDYPAVHHGTGCASCHLQFSNGKLSDHAFKSPTDSQCLSCHYGNYVGADYYGRFEHDFNNEYRTPYTTKEDFFRPYGVEYHPLKSDIHQKAGLVCLDCHSGIELMQADNRHPQCTDCHDKNSLQNSLPPNVTKELKDNLQVYSLELRDGRELTLPLLADNAHFNQRDQFDCQVCHAQWSFFDDKKHYLRSDTDEFDAWTYLTVQGSSEIEHLLGNNTDFAQPELPAEMTDQLANQKKPGVWYKGFTKRRWEDIHLARFDGRITTVRPVLDIYLSWIDEDERVLYDAVPPIPATRRLMPYVPHTTGHAGLFYRNRINAFLLQENKQSPQ